MFPSINNTLTPEQLARRSKRKTKKIDRDHFAHTYSKNTKPKRKHTMDNKQIEQHSAENYCAKLMSINSQKHQQYLLDQMGKAFLSQKQKLYSLLKIKLQQGQPHQQSITKYDHPKEEQINVIDEIDNISHELVEEKESQSMPIWEVRQLKKAESAKMLCDNYENNELIYSVQTLTPRLVREDLEFRFIEDLQ